MNVAADGDWGVDRHDIAFFDQELARFVTQFADLAFGDQAAGPQLLDRPVRQTKLLARGYDVGITWRGVAIPVKVTHIVCGWRKGRGKEGLMRKSERLPPQRKIQMIGFSLGEDKLISAKPWRLCT